ncbi:MAG TPA: glycoside hydrolase [Acidisarcina sp.]
MNPATPLELWGGIECTINRVRDVYFDQMKRCGHRDRERDLEMIHALGLRKLRYGLHWERYCEAGTLEVFAKPLAEMQRLGMEPITGLVHHGSGPRDTSLVDPLFAEKLACYALDLARRYPWLTIYTPVNEPQTTARFSGLYGHWYPHHRSFRSYARALINQMKASVLSMRAIRTVRPDAQFVHTEDGGKTWSTPELADLCEEREHRRWLGTDLLCGMVDQRHPLYGFLRRNGLSEAEILWFANNPCPPDIVGLNYYITSDRFLDHRTELYPRFLRGGDNGKEALVDIEAVRLRRDGIAGAQSILTEAWERYRIPVAITEAHLGGTVRERERWLVEIWNGALAAQADGVECRAVTAWALLGSYDWCSLVTRNEGNYEAGAFDVSGGAPVATDLASVVGRLAAGQAVSLEDTLPGWWTGPGRHTFEPVDENDDDRLGPWEDDDRRCA